MHHSLSLQSSDASIALNDVLGRIAFAASNETGSDALKVAAIVSAIAEGDFDATSNPTSLVFSTGHSETATEKMRITSQGNVGIGTDDPLHKLEIRYNASSDDGLAVLREGSTNDGILIGEQAYPVNDDYQGITHPVYGTSDYMLISRGDHTYMSAKSGYGSYIRSGANGTSYQLYIGPNEASIATNALRVTSSECVLNEAGGNRDFRVETENLTHAIHADANKDEVVIHNAVGYGLNYATSEGWVEASGTQVGYYGGDFTRNGATAENFCEFGDLPNGMRGLIWKSRNNTTDNSADGGWTKNITGVDPEKTYISIVYVRRVGSSTTGNFYHGCRTGGVDTLEMNGSSNTNPYFHAFNIAQLPQDVWCVSIGIIHAHSDPTTTSTGIGGIYRLDTGAKTGTYTNKDYRMGSTATTQNQRTFLYYDTAGTSALDWCWPGFYDITAPAAVNLLNTLLYDHFSGRNIVINEHGDNYDFRVEGDGEQNLLFVDASTDRVGVHTAFPQKDFHVQGTTALRGNTILGGSSIPISSQSIKVVDDSIFSDTATFSTDIVASSGVTLSSAIPATTTNKLYNDAGTLMWDGSEVGSGGSSNLVRGSFAVTSSTTVFTVSGGYSTGSLDVYQNGVKLFKGSSYDFTETGGGTTFTLTNAATNGDLIEYVALNASTSATGNTSLGSVSVTTNQTVFNTSDTFTSSNLAVFLNGVKLVDGTDYNVTSSSQFTLTSTAVSGDIVEYIAYGATVASSNLSKTGDTMTGNLTVNADLIVTGYKETHTDNGNTGTSQTIDISDSTLQTYTLTGNCTFTMPTADAGRSFTVFIKTGAGSFTATFTGAKFPSNSSPVITTDANRMDIITFYSDGTNWYGSIQQEYYV